MANIISRLTNWKNKSNRKSNKIKKLEKKIKDLEKSRDTWKGKAAKYRENITFLQEELKKNP